MLACELERVSIRGDHDRRAAPFLFVFHCSREEVVGLVPVALRSGEPERAHELGQEIELLEELVVELATTLVAVEQLVPVRRHRERVPADDDRARLLRPATGA